MSGILILVAVIIFISILLNNASSKFGIPMLLGFMLLGIVFGSTGILPVEEESYNIVERLCSAALIFILFYGGFGTRIKAAKNILTEAGLLATLGVILTSLITGTLCHFILKWGWIESLLIGSVVGSTDAATVFSILRGRKLGLRNYSAPLLEVESSSNDPMSYLLTVVFLALLKEGIGAGQVVWIFVAQVIFGVIGGILIGKFAIWVVRKIGFATPGFSSLFFIGVVLISYGLPDVVGGNGYLSAYICGMMLGNAKFREKKEMVHFFDGINSLMQVFIFFTIGLLAKPSSLVKEFVPALAIFALMSFVSRPVTIALILTPFRKYPLAQQILLAFSGLKGASSIVFAIVATVGASGLLTHDPFSIVLCIVLLSISIQGGLLPFMAKVLGQVDPEVDVMKTFTDFAEEADLQFTDLHIDASNSWAGKTVAELSLPKSLLICLIRRPDGTKLVPHGKTQILEGDNIIFCSTAYSGESDIKIIEEDIKRDDSRIGKKVSELDLKKGEQLLLIQRGENNIIPYGGTVICEGDNLMINKG
jgi:cell volume regulation protein A